MVHGSRRLTSRGALALLVVLLLGPGVAAARMYEWISPETGTVQVAGSPPAWYRSADQTGPRIVVYDNGRVIDDTSVPVSPEEADKLRKGAFKEYAQRQRAEATRTLERTARLEARRRQEQQRLASEKAAESRPAAASSAASPAAPGHGAPPAALGKSVINQLKALIAEFDKQNAGVAAPGAPAGTSASPAAVPR